MRRSAQFGYALLTVVFLAALILVALSASVPSFYVQGQRELEEELIFRGKQYQRAIGLHFRKTGRFPMKTEDLTGEGESQSKQRFLRKAYRDPMTEDGKWRFIRVGPAGQLYGSVTGKKQLQRQGRPPARPPARQPGRGDKRNKDDDQDDDDSPGSSENSAFFKKEEDEMDHLPFAGVASRSPKEGIKVFDGFSIYKEWEFIFDPVAEAMRRRIMTGPGGRGPERGGRPERPGAGGGRPDQPRR